MHPSAVAQSLPSSPAVSSQVNGTVLSNDLMFLHELCGGRGNAPKDPAERTKYFNLGKKGIQERYGLSKAEFSQLIAVYRMPNVGPVQARQRLEAAALKAVGRKGKPGMVS